MSPVIVLWHFPIFNAMSSESILNQKILFGVKDMVGGDGGLFIPKSDVQKLAEDGHLTMSRRGSTMIQAPSCISLTDKPMDILSDLGAPDGDEEKKQT